MVLYLIIEDDGQNNKVETKRGKLFCTPEPIVEILEDKEEEATEAQEMSDLEMED